MELVRCCRKLVVKSRACVSPRLGDQTVGVICFPLNDTVVSTENYNPANSGLSLQPSLLRAIFNVDPEEVRSLILKKEDVNVQVSRARLSSSCVKGLSAHIGFMHKNCNGSRSLQRLPLIWLLIDHPDRVPPGSFQSVASLSQNKTP